MNKSDWVKISLVVQIVCVNTAMAAGGSRIQEKGNKDIPVTLSTPKSGMVTLKGEDGAYRPVLPQEIEKLGRSGAHQKVLEQPVSDR
jgi:hypothetical protein